MGENPQHTVISLKAGEKQIPSVFTRFETNVRNVTCKQVSVAVWCHYLINKIEDYQNIFLGDHKN